MGRQFALVSGLFCLILWVPTAAHAQGDNPCIADAEKFCKGIQPGEGRIASCLANYLDELSPDCRSLITRLMDQGAVVGKTSMASPGDEKSAAVPAEYQRTYSALKNILAEFDARLNSLGRRTKNRVIFGAELLPANCNRGKDLLNPQAIQGVIVYLDRLKELGVRGTTFPISHPLYLPTFPGYEGYVAFYKQVAQEVRKRGMKLDVESGILFANTSFSHLSLSYAGLTFEKYKAEKREMIAAIIKDLQPDYLNLGAEPDTEAVLTGVREFNDPRQYTEYVNYVLDGLERGRTKIIAGIGTWGNLEYVRRLAAGTSLDGLDIHVYPVIGTSLDNIFAVADIARQYNKGLVMDEAWLYKSEQYLGHDNAAWSELFRRDNYSFWAPLDQQFLAGMVKFARTNNVEYLSPFWTNLFFAYLLYDKDTAKLPYKEMRSMQTRSALPNIINGRFTSTGEYYRKLIQDNQ
jgi:hypothetical protein